MHNPLRYWIIDQITYQVIILSGIANVVLFMLIKLIRTRKEFKVELAQTIRSVLALPMIFTGVNIFAIIVLTDPPAFDKLGEEDLVIVGLITIQGVPFIGVGELFTMLVKETTVAGDVAGSPAPKPAPAQPSGANKK